MPSLEFSRDNLILLLGTTWASSAIAVTGSVFFERAYATTLNNKTKKMYTHVVSAIIRLLILAIELTEIPMFNDKINWLDSRFIVNEYINTCSSIQIGLLSTLLIMELQYADKRDFQTLMHHFATMMMQFLCVLGSSTYLFEVGTAFMLAVGLQFYIDLSMIYYTVGEDIHTKTVITSWSPFHEGGTYFITNIWFALFFYNAWSHITLAAKFIWLTTIFMTGVVQVTSTMHLYGIYCKCAHLEHKLHSN